jgi:putative MATE family efflux protein
MQDLTKGSIVGHLLQFASFIALTTFFQTLYFLVDLYFVGTLGREAIAGVALAGNIFIFVLALTQTLGVGATALVSHAIGAKDRVRADTVFNQAFVMSSVVGVAFGVTAFSLRGVFARAFAADAATADQAIRYLTWFVPAMTLQFGLVALGASLRGIGDMKMPTLIQVCTVVANIVLAPVLTVGWLTGHAFGVTGAALASLIAILIGGVAFVLYFRRPASTVRFHPSSWRPDFTLWRQMLGIGLPAGGEFALMGVYMGLVYHVIQIFGSAAQAGFGIGVRLMQSLFLPAVAIGFAAAPVVGQNFGAREAARVRQTFRTAVALVVAVMAVMTLICRFAPAALVRVFSHDEAVVAFGSEYLSIVSWNFVATGIIFVGSSTMQGLGNTRPALLASLLRLILFALPVFWLAHLPTFSMRHVWYLSLGSVFAHMTLLLWLVQRQFAIRMPPEMTPVPTGAVSEPAQRA